MDALTPVIIGVGEASERIDAPDYRALSPADLAGLASQAALDDAGAGQAIAPHIDLIAAIRQFEVSTPRAVPPFGAADNFPRAIARRLGADPARAVLEVTGGQGPQHLVNELCQAIHDGAVETALITGSESISTVRHLQAQGETRDWAESVGGQMEDRGYGVSGLITGDLIRHGAMTPISVYALFENARRARLGLDRQAYALAMGELFAPFTEVASHNPHAMSREVYTAEQLATVTAANRLTSDPFPRRMVARDQANQGAAVLMTSLGKARELGVPEEKLVYLHGGADAKERTVVEREDISRSRASVLAARQALAAAALEIDQIDLFDLYSCFPIAVFNMLEGLDLALDDPRPFTMTGGLPFFGGAGNNYSMHAIASMVRALRERPGDYGLVGANGGFLSKYSVGIYSTRPAAWHGTDSKALQAEIDAWPAPTMVEAAEGSATVLTYTIDYAGKAPRGIIVGHLDHGGGRFVAMTDPADPAVVEAMIARDPLGARVTVATNAEGLTIIQAFDPA
ncbi:acetyl-CoA acetyltransferase [Phenylobacterium montanum]|uniref:Acetyl-CoA acetyltransferase n=1 Tax=Phenylobacterium montanum TaxID=2823693 RepID=A0A975FY60_9CAUL|nr:acetyl-CoA acetyltransferase [Caulobacter sp. S6]QUD87460.1 acetyl-CoA acetyltransferase [Caulobacter sp. S6]